MTLFKHSYCSFYKRKERVRQKPMKSWSSPCIRAAYPTATAGRRGDGGVWSGFAVLAGEWCLASPWLFQCSHSCH